MKVETKLEIFEDYEDRGLEDRIIKLAANQLAAGVEQQAAETIETKVMEGLKDSVATLFEGIINHPVKRTNSWGEQRGEPTTLRELVMEQAAAYLNEKVDPHKGEVSRYGSDNNIRRIEYVARKAIRDEFEALFSDEIKELKAIARAELEELKNLLNQAKGK